MPRKRRKRKVFPWQLCCSISSCTHISEHQYLMGHNLGDVARGTVLPIIFPVLELSLDHDMVALGTMVLDDLGRLSPCHDIVPLGILGLLAFRVLIALVCRN